MLLSLKLKQMLIKWVWPIAKLVEEDPTLQVNTDEETGPNYS